MVRSIDLFDEGLLRFSVGSLAVANLIVGVLNLVPGLPLDGGRVLQSAVWAVTRRRSVGVTAAAWGGRIAAVALMAVPLIVLPALGYKVTLIDYVLTFMISAFLWTGATHALAVTKIRSRLPALQARTLARPAIGVPADLPVAEAIRRAQEARAGSVVVLTTDGRPVRDRQRGGGPLHPRGRRPWVPVGDLARRLEDGLYLGVDLSGEALLKAMNATPATEYVVLHPDGSHLRRARLQGRGRRLQEPPESPSAVRHTNRSPIPAMRQLHRMIGQPDRRPSPPCPRPLGWLAMPDSRARSHQPTRVGRGYAAGRCGQGSGSG